VHYFIPFSEPTPAKRSTFLEQDDIDAYVKAGKLKKYKYVYEEDKESIEMMFANTEDPQQTMESIISKIIDTDDHDFGNLATWTDCMEKVSEKSQKGSGGKGEDISVLSWRKFKRIFRKATQDDMFANRAESQLSEVRLGEALKTIQPNEVCVIDIANLPEDKQAVVFGDTMRTLYNLKLGEYDGEECVAPPTRLVIFIDELNKYASKDTPKSSPILRQILEVTERGRSLGIVLFAAEQFRSNIVDRVTGNCSTHAYGRTNSIETSTKAVEDWLIAHGKPLNIPHEGFEYHIVYDADNSAFGDNGGDYEDEPIDLDDDVDDEAKIAYLRSLTLDEMDALCAQYDDCGDCPYLGVCLDVYDLD
jgi:hypothetical protein